MAGFLPKDYVGVNTRIDQAHKEHKGKLSIETEFNIKDTTVMFSAKVTIGDQVFTGHSFGTVGREKAFEKLETVAVGRALAFAGFETRDGIASREEMEVFGENEGFSDSKAERSEEKSGNDMMDYVKRMQETEDINELKTIYTEALKLFRSAKQISWLGKEKDTAKARIESIGVPNRFGED